MTSLNGQDLNNWQFKSTDESLWRSFKQPGNCFTALMENQAIVDPFYADNETSLQDIGKKDWEFRAQFSINKTDSKKFITLHAENIDTYADIYINDQLVQATNSAFRIYNIPIHNYCHEGLNSIRFSLHSADSISNILYDKLPNKLPGEHRVVVRKPQYHFGWDFGPRFVSAGLNGKIYLQVYDAISLQECFVKTKSIQSDLASLELFIKMHSEIATNTNIKFKIGDEFFSWQVDIHPGRNEIRIPFIKKNPSLWWPNNYGQQTLYTCELIIDDNSDGGIKKQWKSGIRTIELISNPDSIGQSFYFKINGIPIFIKGANYVPQDIFQTYPHHDSKTLSLLHDTKKCNFNMLRIWGGGNYESDYFYQVCDELGIMIWQDFMFACGMYPGDQNFLQNVSHEAEDQLLRLSQYACIALWCGNNENNEGWHRWGWQFGMMPHTQKRIWTDYQKIFSEILPLAVAHYSNLCNYWESSPLYGRGDKRFVTHGDAHDWGVWHDEMEFDSFRNRVPRFMSEAGFQSLPSLYNIKKWASTHELDLKSTALLSHQKHPKGNKIISKYIERDYPSPQNFEQLIYLNQLAQAEGMCIGIDAHRGAKPYNMGTLYWQYNDCWPGISWSSRDYYGRWKAMQYHVKKAYSPVRFIVEDKDVLMIKLVSDEPKSQSNLVDISIVDFTGNELWKQQVNYETDIAQAKLLLQIKPSDIPEFERRKSIILFKRNDRIIQHYFFDKAKNLQLSDIAHLDLQLFPLDNFVVSDTNYPFTFTLSLQSADLIKSLALEEAEDYYFSDNYFDILPATANQITVYSRRKDLQLSEIKYIYLNQLLK